MGVNFNLAPTMIGSPMRALAMLALKLAAKPISAPADASPYGIERPV